MTVRRICLLCRGVTSMGPTNSDSHRRAGSEPEDGDTLFHCCIHTDDAPGVVEKIERISVSLGSYLDRAELLQGREGPLRNRSGHATKIVSAPCELEPLTRSHLRYLDDKCLLGRKLAV